MTPRPNMGPRIRKYRQALGLSQTELARRLNIHRVNLARMETADTAKYHLRPSLTTLEAIARLLKTNTSTLLGESVRRKTRKKK